MGIVDPVDPVDPDSRRRQRLRLDLARKALWLRERQRRADGNGRLTPEASEAAAIAAGISDPRPTETEAELARLRAGMKYGLTAAQADAMAAVTPEAAEREAALLASTPGTGSDEITAEPDPLGEPTPPGDGGARTPVAPNDPLAEAEAAGDWKTSMSIKSQQLINLNKEQ